MQHFLDALVSINKTSKQVFINFHTDNYGGAKLQVAAGGKETCRAGF